MYENTDWTRAYRWTISTPPGGVPEMYVYDVGWKTLYYGSPQNAPPELLKFCNIDTTPKPKLREIPGLLLCGFRIYVECDTDQDVKDIAEAVERDARVRRAMSAPTAAASEHDRRGA